MQNAPAGLSCHLMSSKTGRERVRRRHAINVLRAVPVVHASYVASTGLCCQAMLQHKCPAARSHLHEIPTTGDHRGHSLETAVRVSWMGVWKGPSSPCHRRLDIKTYQRVALPYAVNYFSSGQDCSRALR